MQVISNLVAKALYAMPTGGLLSIFVEDATSLPAEFDEVLRAQSGRFVARANRGRRRVAIAVDDPNPMLADSIERIAAIKHAHFMTRASDKSCDKATDCARDEKRVECNGAAIISILALALMICMVWVELHLRGL